MKTIKNLLFSLGLAAVSAMPAHAAPSGDDTVKTAYDFTFEAIDGSDMPLAQFKGKVLLVVNTASECGFTPQYKGLQALYERYKAQGLVVVGVPSNDFGGQEPGTNAQIKSFCQVNYGVTFPLASRQTVKGENAHPFYRWASAASGAKPRWNFHKYLIARDGKMIDYFASTTSPDSSSFISALKKALATAPGT